MVEDNAPSALHNFQSTNRKVTPRGPKFVIFNTGDTTPDQFYQITRNCLSAAWQEAVLNVTKISGRGKKPRLTVSVKPELADIWKRHLRNSLTKADIRMQALFSKDMRSTAFANTFPSKWRCVPWLPWSKRKIVEKIQPSHTEERLDLQPFSNIVTWNINGFSSKVEIVAGMLFKYKVGIACLQETLHYSARRPLKIKGYETFGIDREEGFRGQAILVDSLLAAYRIPHEENHLLHVRISHWKTDKGAIKLHIFSIYLPSGGNRRRERKTLLARLCTIKDEILKNEPDSNFLTLGDFNDSSEDIDKILGRWNNETRRMAPVGNSRTRFPKHGIPRSLDHVLANGFFSQYFKKPKVLRRYLASDHKPVLVRAKAKVAVVPNVPRVVFNRDKINGNRQRIASDNRWRILEGSVDEICDGFNSDFDEITRHLGIKKDVINERTPPKMPRKVKALYQLYKESVKVFSNNRSDSNYRKMNQAHKKFRIKYNAWEKSENTKSYTRISEDMLSGDLKSAWTRLNTKTHRESASGMGMPMKPTQPVRNRAGVLVTDPEEVCETVKEHYRSLHQDDPRRRCHLPRYWETTIDALKREESDEERAEDPELTWRDTLESIRVMNRDTSPGKDQIHINMFKALVREECMLQLQTELAPGRVRWEEIQVDLPYEKLPNTPLSKFGKAVWNLLTEVWVNEEMPTAWQENIGISLYKGGNPELPTNYRAITLISVMQKILTALINKHLYLHMARANIFDENQGGFRPGEEAIAQFTVLAEVVKPVLQQHRDFATVKG